MSKAPPTLGIELRFWQNDNSQDWDAMFDALWSWDPDLRPQGFRISSGPGWEIVEERPWDDSRLAELVRLCTGRAAFSWFIGNDTRRYLQCSGRDGRISIGMQIPVPKMAIADRYLDLIDRLPASSRPEMGLIFNYADMDGAFDEEGLRRLRFVPPILHLGPRGVAKLGGDQRVRQVPCEVHDVPGGGMLFVVRPYPFNKATKDDLARTRSVATFLGISEDTPLVLTAATA